jgi:hypothetical protein
MRKLFYIPIVHTPEDLGSHLAQVKREYIAKYGLSKWDNHVEAVDKFWRELKESLLSLSVDYTKMKLYQDGLPVFGREMELVEELAGNGNRNYQLLHELVKKGATIMGSEDPELLIQERDRLLKSGATASYDDLMEKRDRYIAQRIDSTLKECEVGLLFIGALHKVTDKLPEDIQVQKSLTDLKEKEAK